MATQKNKKGLGGSWGLLGIAIVIGIGAFYLTNKYLVNKEAALRDLLMGKDAGAMVSVVVATTNLVPGDAVGPENMAVVELLGEHVSQFAVTPGIFGDFQGHVLERPMSKGEPLLAHFMAGRVVARFSELIEVGERAVTIEIDEFATDSYMLTAGDFVDIFLLMDLPKPQVLASAGGSSGTEKILMPLLQKIKVIALGPMSLRSKEQSFIHPGVSSDDDGYGTVTVAVRVMDAAKLEMARVTGEFVFMLRNSEDKENKSIKAIN
ncbi:MAG: Flp pilus assembly protein CpaB, partial [Xanthomonadales bacterium]|nr:Flp pilus assembly protein CpaB [Xanthomonadales bacterium]